MICRPDCDKPIIAPPAGKDSGCRDGRAVPQFDGMAEQTPMDLRFRLLMITLVAVMAAAVWTFPLWRGHLPDARVQEAFPGLELDLQDEFLALPAAERNALLELRGKDAAMALEMARVAVRGTAAAPSNEQDRSAVAGGRTLAAGNFIEIDALHWGEGTAALYQLPDGRHILRFEDFTSARGGNVYVYLARDPQPRNAVEVGKSFLDLGRLKGSSGNQNYFLPSGHDVTVYQSAVVFCRQFNAVITSARLR